MDYEHTILVVLALYFGFLTLALTYLYSAMLLILATHPRLPKQLLQLLGGRREAQQNEG